MERLSDVRRTESGDERSRAPGGIFLAKGLMNTKAKELAGALIRNFDDVEKTLDVRSPLYETLFARLASSTAARRLGASIDIVAPGKRSCPYHFHHGQEEMFVILEGEGTLRVAEELLPI